MPGVQYSSLSSSVNWGTSSVIRDRSSVIRDRSSVIWDRSSVKSGMAPSFSMTTVESIILACGLSRTMVSRLIVASTTVSFIAIVVFPSVWSYTPFGNTTVLFILMVTVVFILLRT